MAEETDFFAVQMLRDLIEKKVFPCHRLDRPTSGVLLFGLNKETASLLGKMFMTGKFDKRYVALVRGWFPENDFTLNNPVKNEKGNFVEAETKFGLIKRIELPIAVKPYQTSRYSVVSANPVSGRRHQIRQHLAHLRHYIVNDRVHGTGAHNKMFTEQLEISNLFLHAEKLSFNHPITEEKITIEAEFPEHWSTFRSICDQLAGKVKS
jgi:tRNA pseudouridine65 synthase